MGRSRGYLVERIGVEVARELFDADPEVASTISGCCMSRSCSRVATSRPKHEQGSYLIEDVVLAVSFSTPHRADRSRQDGHRALSVADDCTGQGDLRSPGKNGKVMYFAGENDVDISARWILLCEKHNVKPEDVDVVFMPTLQTLSDETFQRALDRRSQALWPRGLDVRGYERGLLRHGRENTNTQILAHAKVLRSFIKSLPGKPTVIVLCHPVKSPNMDNLLPRGGGAFVDEIDGNLCCKMVPGTMLVDLHTHGKFRGVEFDPLSFRLISATSDKLVDRVTGTSIPSVYAQELDDAQREAVTERSGNDQDALLDLLLKSPGVSQAELAAKLEWFDGKGDPYKVKVGRLLTKALLPKGLVEKDNHDKWKLTQKGEKVAKTVVLRSKPEDEEPLPF